MYQPMILHEMTWQWLYWERASWRRADQQIRKNDRQPLLSLDVACSGQRVDRGQFDVAFCLFGRFCLPCASHKLELDCAATTTPENL